MQTEYSFNLGTVLTALRKFWLMILVVTVVAGLLGLGYTLVFRSNVYIGTASFWVSSDTGISQSSTLGASQMATNYMELCEQDILLRRAVKDGSLDEKWNCTEDDAVAYLRSVTGASKTGSDSCIFSLSVRASSPKLAFEAIYALQYAMDDIVSELSQDNLGGGHITLVGEVLTERDITVSTPNYLRNSLLAALGGLLVALVVFTAVEVRKESKQNKVSTEESEEKNEQ